MFFFNNRLRRYEENGKYEHIAYIIKYFYKLNIHYFRIFFSRHTLLDTLF